jgi:hypothetical protein
MWRATVTLASGIRLRGFRGRWCDALLVELEELCSELWVDSDEELELCNWGNPAMAGMIC